MNGDLYAWIQRARDIDLAVEELHRSVIQPMIVRLLWPSRTALRLTATCPSAAIAVETRAYVEEIYPDIVLVTVIRDDTEGHDDIDP